MKSSKYFLFVIYLISCGCSSFAYKKYACEKEAPLNKFYGNLFQIGDCALSKSIYIETGDYYRYSKWSIDLAVEVHIKDKTKTYESLHNFAKVFNCDESAFQSFADMLSNKKQEIFGEKFDKTSRRVTLNIIQSIEDNPFLKTQCMR